MSRRLPQVCFENQGSRAAPLFRAWQEAAEALAPAASTTLRSRFATSSNTTRAKTNVVASGMFASSQQLRAELPEGGDEHRSEGPESQPRRQLASHGPEPSVVPQSSPNRCDSVPLCNSTVTKTWTNISVDNCPRTAKRRLQSALFSLWTVFHGGFREFVRPGCRPRRSEPQPGCAPSSHFLKGHHRRGCRTPCRWGTQRREKHNNTRRTELPRAEPVGLPHAYGIGNAQLPRQIAR
jgi:hypothetical protein